MPKLVSDKCDGCGICEETCEQGAISMVDSKPQIDMELCIGCGECVQACPTDALVGKPKPAAVNP